MCHCANCYIWLFCVKFYLGVIVLGECKNFHSIIGLYPFRKSGSIQWMGPRVIPSVMEMDRRLGERQNNSVLILLECKYPLGRSRPALSAVVITPTPSFNNPLRDKPSALGSAIGTSLCLCGPCLPQSARARERDGSL